MIDDLGGGREKGPTISVIWPVVQGNFLKQFENGSGMSGRHITVDLAGCGDCWSF
jgi:hypothetical protein